MPFLFRVLMVYRVQIITLKAYLKAINTNIEIPYFLFSTNYRVYIGQKIKRKLYNKCTLEQTLNAAKH